jgi:hypothetical protein
VPAAERAGEVPAGGDHVAPAPLDGGQQILVVLLDRDVDRTAVQVHLAHAVAGHLGRLADRLVVLPVGGAEPAVAQQPVAAQVEHPGRQSEVARLAQLAAEFGQGHLDLGVPVDAGPPGRTELPVDVLDRPDRDVEQPVVAERRRQAIAAWMRWPTQ